VTYTLSGTPTSFGTLTADIDIAGILTCATSTTVISASDNILAQIGNEGDDPDVINSVVTVAQLNLITPALTGVTAGNETAYQDYIDANPNDFSSPATQAEVQAMITAVNNSQTVLAQIGNEGDDPDVVNSVVTVAQLNTITPALTGVTAGNETAYQDYIDGNPNDFSSPATQPEVQAMITAVNTSQTVLAQIGNEGDDPDVVNSVVTVAELNTITPALTGVTAGNETAYQDYIDANPNDFSSPATQPEVQAMITAVNTSQTVLAQIGNEGDDPDVVNSVVTVAELNTITPALTGVTAGNETAYQDYIDANPNDFSSPATQPEVQAMITAVNTSQTVLAQIGNEGDDPDLVNSVVTVAQLNTITPALTGVTAGNETAYQDYIDANPNDFSSPATQPEVQAMITAVNTSQTVLAKIGNEADDPDVVTSVVTVAELNTIIPALTGVNASFEAAYQNYIDANPNDFSSPATQPEVQAMITYVAANPPIPATITLGTGESYTVASLYDQDYLPYTTPTGPAVTTAVAADGTNDSPTIDVQGSITTTGVTVSIPVTATGSGTLPAYTSTITIPANLTEDGISRDLTLSWASQAFTVGTTSITATLAAVGGTLNAKKLDLNGGIGNNNLGVLMGTFNYPINNAGTTTTFEVRIISGIPDREFGDGVHDFIYLPVTNPTTGETWLNNNLGASYANVNHPDFNPIQQATSATDNKAYGSLYQWGRYSDGHELINRNAGDPHATSGTTSTLSNTDQPPHDDFITSNSGNFDWRNPQNNNLWQGENGTNNPCPNGYRLPTEGELNAERLSWSSNNAAGAFASPLKLPMAGYRNRGDGTIYVTGYGYCWSSTVSGTDVRRLDFYSSGAGIVTNHRANGRSVRCIKD
jgi:phosphoheptose isomerase